MRVHLAVTSIWFPIFIVACQNLTHIPLVIEHGTSCMLSNNSTTEQRSPHYAESSIMNNRLLRAENNWIWWKRWPGAYISENSTHLNLQDWAYFAQKSGQRTIKEPYSEHKVNVIYINIYKLYISYRPIRHTTQKTNNYWFVDKVIQSYRPD